MSDYVNTPDELSILENWMGIINNDCFIDDDMRKERLTFVQSLKGKPLPQWCPKNYDEYEKFLADDKTISDYEPRFSFLPRSYSRHYYQYKNMYHDGPFKAVDLLSFHLTVDRLMENEKASIQMLESDTKAVLETGASYVLTGQKSFHDALFWVAKEMYYLTNKARKSHMVTITYIGTPNFPMGWSDKLAEKLRAENKVPEELHTTYEPEFQERITALFDYQWNGDLVNAILTSKVEAVGDNLIPENAWNLPQHMDAAKYEAHKATEPVRVKISSSIPGPGNY